MTRTQLDPFRRGDVVALVLGAALLLTGTGPSAAQPKPSAGAETPIPGGTLTERIAADPACADPAQLRLRAALGVMRQVVDSLTFQDVDGTIQPWLASSWEISSDSTAYTFHIRPGVTFTDGSKLDAQTVADNITWLKSAGAQAPVVAPYVAAMTAATATDASTVVVTFGTPQAQFIQAVSTPSMGIVSEATLKTPPGTRCAQGVVGSGPFVLTSYTRNEGLVLTRNPSYAWAPKTFANQGAAYFSTIKVAIVPDASVGTGMLLSAQVDYETDVADADFQRIQDAGAVVYSRAMPGFGMAMFVNVKRGPLQDQAVRYALLHGLDRKALMPASGSDLEVPATNVLSPNTPGYANQAELLHHDEDGSAKMLEAAGWKLGSDGIRAKDGRKLQFGINYMSPSSDMWAPFLQLVQQSYAKLGIRVRLNPMSATQDTQLLLSGNYDLRYNGLSRGDPDVLTSTFAGIDPDLDGLLAKQASQSDGGQRDKTVAQATEHILKMGYIVPLNDAIQGQAYSSKLRGTVYDNTNTPSFSGAWLAR